MTPEIGFVFFVGLVLGWTLAVVQGRAEEGAEFERNWRRIKERMRRGPCRQRPDTN